MGTTIQLRSLEALLLQNAVTKVAYMQAIEILGLALSRLTHSSKGRVLNLNLRGVVLDTTPTLFIFQSSLPTHLV